MNCTRRNSPQKYLNLLIVVDEIDAVKRCMHDVKTALETIQLNKVKHRSLFDPVNEKGSIKCDKLLILISGKRPTKLEHDWIQNLPDIKGDPRKYMVLRFKIESDENSEDEQVQLYSASDKSDAMEWFSNVLEFLFPIKGTTMDNAVKLQVNDIDSASERSEGMRNRIKCFLQTKFKLDDRNTQSANAFVVLCDNLNQEIETATKQTLRQQKLTGCTICVLSCSYIEECSDDIKWIATQTYTRKDSLRFIIHLYERLQLIDVNLDIVKTNINKPKPISGVIKVSQPGPRRTGKLLIEWPLDSMSSSSNTYIHVQHRTNTSRVWVTIADNIPATNTSYEVDNLETSYSHQFQVLRETADGISAPLSSMWFSWQTYSKRNIVLKIFLYIACIVTGLFAAPQFAVIVLTCLWIAFLKMGQQVERKKSTPEKLLASGTYGMFCFIPGIVTLVLYAGRQSDAYSHWLLFTGLYFVIWCLVIHFIVVCVTGNLFGLMLLPLIFYNKAKDLNITNIYIRDDATSSV